MSKKEKPTVSLTPYIALIANEDDWYRWVNHVRTHIEERCGFEVDVETEIFGSKNIAFKNTISGADYHQEETIKEALQIMWDEGNWE